MDRRNLTRKKLLLTELYLEHCKANVTARFYKNIIGFKPITIFTKNLYHR